MFLQNLIAFCIMLAVNTLNYYFTYDTSLVNPRLLFQIFLFHTIQGLFFWWMLLQLEARLSLPWHYQSWQLYLKNQFAHIVLLLIVAFACLLVFSKLLIAPWLLPMQEIEYLSLIGCMAVALQVNQAFWQWKKQQIDTKKRTLNVQRGSKFFELPLFDVMFIETDGDLVHVTSRSGQQYYADHSIREILKFLSNDFFKVTPQFIIHRDSVAYYRESVSKGIVLQIWQQGNTSIIRLLPNKAKAFKRWYEAKMLSTPVTRSL